MKKGYVLKKIGYLSLTVVLVTAAVMGSQLNPENKAANNNAAAPVATPSTPTILSGKAQELVKKAALVQFLKKHPDFKGKPASSAQPNKV